MKAKKLLAVLLALCLLISAMPMGMLFSASALSGELDPGRITYYNDIRELVTNSACNLNGGKAENLFDGTIEKMEGAWVEGGVIVTFETTRATTITAYTMKTQDDGSYPNRMPKSWTLYGSTDGETWVALDSVSNYPVVNVNNVFYDDDFRIDAPAAYTHYKMHYTANAGDGHFQVAELVLSEFDLSGIIAVESKIDALDEKADTFADDVAAARTAYDALGDVKASVNNYAELKAAENKVAVAGTEDKEKATAAVNAIAAIGEATYKSKAAIEAAEAAWNALSDNDKTVLSAYGTELSEARTQYEELIDGFNWQITTNRPEYVVDKEGVTHIPEHKWLKDCSDDAWNATRADMADSVKYAYANGRNLGFTNGGASDNFQAWMTEDIMWYIRLGGSDDNYNNQDWQNKSTIVVAPFPGIGFGVDTTFAQSYWFERSLAIGESFEWNGKIYQVMWNGYRSYDAAVIPSSSGNVEDSGRVNVQDVNVEEIADSSETGKNIFRYAYAKYSSENRWAGLTYGLPQSQYAIAVGDETRVQAYDGPQGKAYLFTTLTMINAAPTDMAADNYTSNMDNAYFAVTGTLAKVIANTGDLFDKCGDIVSVSDTAIVFENGTVTADGFAENDNAAAARVQAIIDALPAADDVQASDENAIKAARSEFEAISEAAKALVNTGKLTAAEQALTDVLEGPAEAVALVKEIDEIGTVTYKSRPAIEAARAKYDAMDAETQGYVSNYSVLIAAEAALKAIYDAVDITFTAYSDKTFSITPWMNNGVISDENMSATAAAWSNAIKFYYTERQYNVGNQSDRNWLNGTRTMDEYRGAPGAEIDISDSTKTDNIGNPWGHGNRYISMINSPFSGTAFIYTEYFAAVGKGGYWNQPALSESFTVGDKVYQIGWSFLLSRDVNGTNVTRDNALYPGSGIDNNTFKYAVAKNAYAEKVSGDIYGYPATAAVKSGDTTYQKYVSDNGTVYLVSSSAIIDSVTAATDSSEYEVQLAAAAPYVVSGDLAAVIDSDASFLEEAGAIVSVSDTAIVFANGTLTADGFELDPNYAAAKSVVDAIAALGEITIEDKDAVAAARDAYNNLTDEQKALVSNVDLLNAAMETMKKLILDVELGINISDGAATAGDNGRVNITWNANVTIGENDTIPDINSKLTFTGYGVYYGTGADAVTTLANGGETALAKKMAFAVGSNVDVYTIFGFRLTGIAPDRTRAAMFYITFEYEGYSYTVLSDCVEAQATVE